MRKNIKLVIFDLAGTTIDFGCMAPVYPFIYALEQHGLKTSIDEVRQYMGLYKKDHIEALLMLPRHRQTWQDLYRRPYHEGDVDSMYAIVTKLQMEAVAHYSELIPDALETISNLRQRGIKIATTTGYFREAATTALSNAFKQGFEPDFSICADDVPAGRPAPWMIFRAMEATGVYPVTSVIKVGDTLIDIEDGLNAGVHSVGVVDSSNLMGLTQSEFSSLTAEEREFKRSQIKQIYQRHHASYVVNQLMDLIPFIENFD